MALVSLKNVKVYATFSKGFRVVEEFTHRNGETYKTRWTVWADAMESGPIREGDVINVSGFLSARVNEWTDTEQQVHHSVELSLNSPRIDRGEEKPEEPPADTWYPPESGAYDDDQAVPF